MTLALTLLGLVAGLIVLFWGLTTAIQGALYQSTVDRALVRAAVAGLLVGTFLTVWVVINTRSKQPDKFGTLLAFSSTSTQPVPGFTAVRRLRVPGPDGAAREESVPFRYQPGVGAAAAFLDPAGQPFRRATSDYMTIALLVPDGEQSVRFQAREANGTYQLENGYVVFQEEGGARSVCDENLRLMTVPSRGGAIVALLLNLLHFVVWVAAFWPAMRFTLGHALGLTALFGTVSLFVLMPLLFNLNRVAPVG